MDSKIYPIQVEYKEHKVILSFYFFTSSTLRLVHSCLKFFVHPMMSGKLRAYGFGKAKIPTKVGAL
jgi:hypothetical protein